MPQKLIASMQEALAVIGLSLFAFGVWQIYRPAAFIVVGLILCAPFARTLKGGAA